MTSHTVHFEHWVRLVRHCMDAAEAHTYAITRDELDSLERSWRRSLFEERYDSLPHCAFCGGPFGESQKDRSVPRKETLGALESPMCLSVWNMLDRDPTLLRVIASLANGGERSLCNYCHTRVTVSRDAAEAL